MKKVTIRLQKYIIHINPNQSTFRKNHLKTQNYLKLPKDGLNTP